MTIIIYQIVNNISGPLKFGNLHHVVLRGELYQHEKFYLINKNCTWCSYDVWFYPSASTQIPRFATLFGHWQLVGHLLPCQFGQSVRQQYSAFWPSSHSSLLKGTKTCVIQFPYKALEHLLIDCQKKTKPTYKEAIIQQQNEFKIKIIKLPKIKEIGVTSLNPSIPRSY